MPRSVILLSDVPGLGQIGDQCKVKDGFACNYLLPKRLAVVASPEVIKRFEKQKEKLAETRAKQLAGAQNMGEKLGKVGLVFERPIGPGGRLFGSVTPMDIVAELAKQGVGVDKKSVLMHASIKTVGDHIVRVRVHSKVRVDIPVKVIGLQVKQSSQPAPEEENIVYGKADD